jgi:RTX calcium-binding nonapeptide repeat (4 copies)/FG-GAP-like repeat/FG-GAP repeat
MRLAISTAVGMSLLSIVSAGSATVQAGTPSVRPPFGMPGLMETSARTPLGLAGSAPVPLRGPRAVQHANAAALDLVTQANIRLDGASAGAMAGASVAGGGDINGDGRPDLVIGATGAGNNGRVDSGSVYVIFGQARTATIDLGHLGTRGYRIDGRAVNTIAGESVAVAGDVNVDGHPDLVVGASSAAYVVFGQASTETIDLATLGTKGFLIQGINNAEGPSVAGAGDVNGDGRPDVAIGNSSGPAYVVFGKADPTTIDLAQLGARGYRIDNPKDSACTSVADVGDVNGDGHPDLVVGSPDANNNGRDQSGSAFVVFGQADTTTIDLDQLGAKGYRIDGVAGNDGAGWSVAGAGDVNGDGRPDVLLGAPGASNKGGGFAGGAYVVFGKADTATIDLGRLGTKGYRIYGAQDGDQVGGSVAAASDVNGDGRPDLVIGAEFARNDGHDRTGAAYVVFGQAGTSPIDLRELGASGYRIGGNAVSSGGAGTSVAGVGDVNGDGRPDVLIGAYASRNNARRRSGSAYVVFSPSLVTGSRGADRLHGSSGTDLIFGLAGGDTIRGGGGNDIIEGGPGRDRLLGGTGNDRIEGGPGRDQLLGDTGRDTLLGRDRTRDRINGGPGRDRAQIDRRRDFVRNVESFL